MSNAPQPPADSPPEADPSNAEPPDDELTFSAGIVRAAIIFEGLLAVAAYFLGELVERPPGERIHLNVADAFWGVAAAAPLLVLLVVLMRLPIAAIERLRGFCREMLLPMFREATWRQVLLLCFLAGLGEEMLFRGVIQLGLADAIGGTQGIVAGLSIAAVTFGLAHAATRTYAIVAGLIGLYLGGVLLVSGNLLVPIVAHAVYDLGAFVFLFRMNDDAVAAKQDDAATAAKRTLQRSEEEW